MCVYIFRCCFDFFFFKQKTAYELRISDWSSDVCSSDLAEDIYRFEGDEPDIGYLPQLRREIAEPLLFVDDLDHDRPVILQRVAAMELRRATEAEHRPTDSYARELLLPRKSRDAFDDSPVAAECRFRRFMAHEIATASCRERVRRSVEV